VTEAVIGTEGIKIQFDVSALLHDMTAADELIASARLKSGVLLITRQVMGFKATGTIILKYPDLQAGEVESCYLFVRSGDGKKTSNSVFVGVNS